MLGGPAEVADDQSGLVLGPVAESDGPGVSRSEGGRAGGVRRAPPSAGCPQVVSGGCPVVCPAVASACGPAFVIRQLGTPVQMDTQTLAGLYQKPCRSDRALRRASAAAPHS